MSLKNATQMHSQLPSLPEGPPYKCAHLEQWQGQSFWLKPTDKRLLPIHHGQPAPTPPLENLQGMVRYWIEQPEWMNMLNPNSPAFAAKILEREIYQQHWNKYLSPHKRILDVGGGVGRMTQWLLRNHCTVEVIEPDLRSIWRLISNIAGFPGKIDVHWSTAEKMPSLGHFDVALACEVLNYVEDPHACVSRIYNSLKPSGMVLLSVEARWGWALSNDVAEGTAEAFFQTGVIHVPGDRWIQTFTKPQIEQLLSDFNILDIVPGHYTLSGPFEDIIGQQPTLKMLEWEERFKTHPIAKQLNRTWIVTAQKPKQTTM